MIKKLLRYITCILLILLSVVFLLPLLLYTPVVQEFAKNEVQSRLSKQLDMTVSVSRIRLNFPLNLSVDTIKIIKPPADTLLLCDEIKVRVALLPLLRKEVSISWLSFRNAHFDYGSEKTGMRISVQAKSFQVKPSVVDLGSQDIKLSQVDLSGASGKIKIGVSQKDSVQNDTIGIKWKISAEKVAISDINLNLSLPNPQADISAVLQKATVDSCLVDLGRQQVDALSCILYPGQYSYIYAPRPAAPAVKNTSSDTVSSGTNWTVMVRRISIRDNQLLYANRDAVSSNVFNPEYIEVNHFNTEIDTFYNQGSSVYAKVSKFQAQERSGLEIKSLSGIFGLRDMVLQVADTKIQTAQSQLSLSANVAFGFFARQVNAPVSGKFSGKLALADFSPFLDSLFTEHRELKNITAEISGDIAGNWGRMKAKELNVNVPGYVRWQANGEASDLLHPEKISGSLYSRCDIINGKLVSAFLDSPGKKRILIPDKTSLILNARALSGDIQPHISLLSDSNLLSVSGSVSLPRKQYDIKLRVDSFPLDRFLPDDSLGRLSLTSSVSGAGYDFLQPETRLKAGLQLKSLVYRGYDYRDIDLESKLENGAYTLTLNSASPALDMGLSAAGKIEKQGGDLSLSGDFRQIDLKRLNFSSSESVLAFGLKIDASATDSLTFKVDTRISGTSWQTNYRKNKFRDIDVHVDGSRSYLSANVQSGDFRADFHSTDNVSRFSDKLGRSISLLSQQIRQGTVNMENIQEGMPGFRLTANAGTNNFINNFLKSKNLQIKDASLLAVSDSVSPFLLQGNIGGFTAQQIVLDSLSWKFAQADSSLFYDIRLVNLPANSLDIATAGLRGKWNANLLDMDCYETNQKGETGFRFNSRLSYTDSLISYMYLPPEPVLGFEQWHINPNNYITYRFGRSISADFRLTSGNKKFMVVSTSDNGVQFSLSGIDIGASLKALPFAPPVDGILAAEVTLSPSKVHFNTQGKLSVDSLGYDHVPIGDVDLSLSHLCLADDTVSSQYQVKADLDIDRKNVVSVKGRYRAEAEKGIDAEIDVSDFPLKHINPFIPEAMALLEGVLNSNIHISGNATRPNLAGDFRFGDARVSVPMIGTTFGFSPDPIRIVDNAVVFDRYAISGANKNALYIDGKVSSQDLSRYYADLSVRATDFQPINISKNSSSLLYGKVNMDINSTIRGELDELSVRGDISLLNGTDATYVLKDSPLEVKEQTRSMVTFVSFSDTTQMYEPENRSNIKIGGLSVLMNVEIGQSVKMAVNLSDDGENRINLQGGGNLTYSQNPLGDSRFSGRYVLTGGTVRYNPPIISEKIFNIQDGSYVEWLGDITDPTLSITAVETVKASVSENDKNSRLVNFDIIIRIQNTLDDLSVSFDLKTTDDLSIQNQLASLTAEQRAAQAMNLLIYNTYNGPGTVGKSNITGNPLNSFIQQELNQWARNNLKNIDLSFGIDSYDGMFNGAAGSRTDYSYKLSKNLFDDRVKVVIGGSFKTDADPSMNVKENLIDDISLEYMLNKRDNMFLKVFRHTNYESILEGEVVQTGFGFVVRKKLQHLRNLFIPAKKTEEKPKNE